MFYIYLNNNIYLSCLSIVLIFDKFSSAAKSLPCMPAVVTRSVYECRKVLMKARSWSAPSSERYARSPGS